MIVDTKEYLLLRDSVLVLISFIRVVGKKDIQSIKSSWSVLHAELKACVYPLCRDINKGHKINTNTHTHTHAHTHTYTQSKLVKYKRIFFFQS